MPEVLVEEDENDSDEPTAEQKVLSIMLGRSTFLHESFLSNRRFKKGCFLKKKSIFYLAIFAHFLPKKRTFCHPTTFIKSLITHKRFIFKETYISYGKRQKYFNCYFSQMFVSDVSDF